MHLVFVDHVHELFTEGGWREFDGMGNPRGAQPESVCPPVLTKKLSHLDNQLKPPQFCYPYEVI